MTGSILFETPSPLRLRVIFFHSELTFFFLKQNLTKKNYSTFLIHLHIFEPKAWKEWQGKKWKSPALLIVQIRKFSIKRNWKIQNKYVEFSCSRFTLSQDKKEWGFQKKKKICRSLSYFHTSFLLHTFINIFFYWFYSYAFAHTSILNFLWH